MGRQRSAAHLAARETESGPESEVPACACTVTSAHNTTAADCEQRRRGSNRSSR
jgi:hypothetical protein